MRILEAEGGVVGEEELLARVAAPVSPACPPGWSGRADSVLVGLLRSLWWGENLVLAEGEAEVGSGGAPLGGRPSAGPLPLRKRPPRTFAEVREACTSPGEGRVTLLTSGTTGQPRPVTHSLRTLLRGVRLGARHRGKVWGLAYPPAHMAGVQVLLQAAANGCDLASLPERSPADVAGVLRDHGVTHLSATPSFYRLLLPYLGTCPSVEQVTLGGEPVGESLLRGLRVAFPRSRVRNVYASTEAGTLFATDGVFFRVPATLRERVRVVEGQLWLRRDLLGVTGDNLDAQPWYPTGDRVELAGEDPLCFRVLGRVADTCKVGGQRVDTAAVAERLRSYPGVRDARVRAIPNSVLGSVLVAELIAAENPPPDETELRRRLTRETSPYAVPRRFTWVEALPQGPTGKACP